MEHSAQVAAQVAGRFAKVTEDVEIAEMSRQVASRRLGCSIAQLVKFEQEGRIRVRREKPPGTRVWLRTEDVDHVSLTWKRQRRQRSERIDSSEIVSNARGQAAGLCYPLFAQKMDLRDVVEKTRVDPILVRQLYEEFLVSLEDGIRRRIQREQAEEERRLQIQHDRRKGQAQHWERKLELARIEAAGKKADLARREIEHAEKKLAEARERVRKEEEEQGR